MRSFPTRPPPTAAEVLEVVVVGLIVIEVVLALIHR